MFCTMMSRLAHEVSILRKHVKACEDSDGVARHSRDIVCCLSLAKKGFVIMSLHCMLCTVISERLAHRSAMAFWPQPQCQGASSLGTIRYLWSSGILLLRMLYHILDFFPRRYHGTPLRPLHRFSILLWLHAGYLVRPCPGRESSILQVGASFQFRSFDPSSPHFGVRQSGDHHVCACQSLQYAEVSQSDGFDPQ